MKISPWVYPAWRGTEWHNADFFISILGDRVATMENQERYRKAKKRVEAKIGFYLHSAVYVVVNILLIIVNLTTSTKYLWFKWPLIVWGLGLLFHSIGVKFSSAGYSIKERMIKKEMEKYSDHKWSLSALSFSPPSVWRGGGWVVHPIGQRMGLRIFTWALSIHSYTTAPESLWSNV